MSLSAPIYLYSRSGFPTETPLIMQRAFSGLAGAELCLLGIYAAIGYAIVYTAATHYRYDASLYIKIINLPYSASLGYISNINVL